MSVWTEIELNDMITDLKAEIKINLKMAEEETVKDDQSTIILKNKIDQMLKTMQWLESELNSLGTVETEVPDLKTHTGIIGRFGLDNY